MALKSYRDLEVWRVSMDLVESVYRLTRQMPSDERFGLISQLQRAAVSVPANIAEGYGRLHRGDYRHHLSIARGSVMELETLLTLAVRLGYLQRDDTLPTWEQTQSVGRLLHKLIISLKPPPKHS